MVVDRQSGSALTVGCSAGGMAALRAILSRLPVDFPWPVVVVAHVSEDGGGLLAEILSRDCPITVREVEDKEPVLAGCIHLAPAGYHLLVERDHTFSLSVDPKVNNCRPAIDVTFSSAAEVYGSGLVGLILTGANQDGAAGLLAIKAHGGRGIVQDPSTAQASAMPMAAIAAGGADWILPLANIAPWLITLSQKGA